MSNTPIIIKENLILGRNTLPSVVAVSDEEILVGKSALNCNTELSNVLYGRIIYKILYRTKISSDSKRLIGWHVLNNLPIAKNLHLWTFNADTRNVKCIFLFRTIKKFRTVPDTF